MRWSRWFTWCGLVVVITSMTIGSLLPPAGQSFGYYVSLIAFTTVITLAGLVVITMGFVIAVGELTDAQSPRRLADVVTCFVGGGVLVTMTVLIAMSGLWWLVVVPSLGTALGLWRLLHPPKSRASQLRRLAILDDPRSGDPHGS